MSSYQNNQDQSTRDSTYCKSYVNAANNESDLSSNGYRRNRDANILDRLPNNQRNYSHQIKRNRPLSELKKERHNQITQKQSQMIIRELNAKNTQKINQTLKNFTQSYQKLVKTIVKRLIIPNHNVIQLGGKRAKRKVMSNLNNWLKQTKDRIENNQNSRLFTKFKVPQ